MQFPPINIELLIGASMSIQDGLQTYKKEQEMAKIVWEDLPQVKDGVSFGGLWRPKVPEG